MGIMCPECGGDTVIYRVTDKHRDGEKMQHRKRRCTVCRYTFGTIETVIEGSGRYPKVNTDPPITLEEIKEMYEKFGLM